MSFHRTKNISCYTAESDTARRHSNVFSLSAVFTDAINFIKNDVKFMSHIQQQQRQRSRLFDKNRDISLLDVEDTSLKNEDNNPSNNKSLLETLHYIHPALLPELQQVNSFSVYGSSRQSLSSHEVYVAHQQVKHGLSYALNMLDLELLCKCIVFASRVLLWPVVCDP